MTGRVIFLLEEPSMAALLNVLLPRLIPDWEAEIDFLCIPHEGKSDLDRSIPRKLQGWREPGARFVIVRDNDNADCVAVKKRIKILCNKSGRPDTLVRLVCQELESWYVGDLVALASAYPDIEVNTVRHRKRFAKPDSLNKPSVELKSAVPSFQKLSGARAIAPHLSLSAENNTSHSFGVFIAGVRQIANVAAPD
ncbi:DUF4276 family protein [Burkholderia gladioli]|nr:DUF4276 family protein [Burkholderia gladioli]